MAEVYYGTGRRKTSTARVFLTEGKGEVTINDRSIEEFFGLASTQKIAMQSVDLLKLRDKLNLKIHVRGGGPTGQAGAIRMGVARALCLLDDKNRAELKKAGYLTRDSRKVERKKYGRAGARKRFQFSKR